MELQFPSFTTLLLTFFFLFMVFKILKIGSNFFAKNPKPKLPPGPRKLPLIGNMHQLISPLPHQTLRNLAMKYGPLMHLQLGGVPTIVISSPEIAKEVLKDNGTIFAQRPRLLAPTILSYNAVSIVFSPHGNYWKLLRKICTMELLSPSRVQSFRSIREDEVSALINTIASEEGKLINLSEKVFSMIYGITSRAAFGNKSKRQKEIIRVVAESTKLASGFCLADLYPSSKLLKLFSGVRIQLEKLQRTSDQILETFVIEHKEKLMKRKLENGRNDQHEDEDLLDVLLRLQDSDDEIPLTNDKIKAVILDILGAGSETASTTIEWAMSEMLRNPSLMRQAQAEVRHVFNGKGKVDEAGIHELKLLKSIVKETLRLHPPVPLLLPRENDENCVISGYDVVAKTRVIVNAWAMGRDPRYWKEAERFYPERFLDTSIDFRGMNFEYIPFGAGRRICPGISFALPSMELPLAKLLYHFDWELPNGSKFEDLDMDESFGLSMRRKNDLFLIPIVYHPSNY